MTGESTEFIFGGERYVPLLTEMFERFASDGEANEIDRPKGCKFYTMQSPKPQELCVADIEEVVALQLNLVDVGMKSPVLMTEQRGTVLWDRKVTTEQWEIIWRVRLFNYLGYGHIGGWTYDVLHNDRWLHNPFTTLPSLPLESVTRTNLLGWSEILMGLLKDRLAMADQMRWYGSHWY